MGRSRVVQFRAVVVVSSIISAVLWVCAGSIAAVTGDFFSYTIVGILAGVAGIVAVNGARKEGFAAGEVHGLVGSRQKTEE